MQDDKNWKRRKVTIGKGEKKRTGRDNKIRGAVLRIYNKRKDSTLHFY